MLSPHHVEPRDETLTLGWRTPSSAPDLVTRLAGEGPEERKESRDINIKMSLKSPHRLRIVISQDKNQGKWPLTESLRLN